jgi:hypothetical protein
MTPRSGRTMTRPPVRWLLAIGLVCVSVAMPGTAHAFWTEGAAGTGTARVASLPAVEVTGSSPQHSARVELEWDEPTLPAGMSVGGYRVQRSVAGVLADACDSSASALLSPATLACTDALLDDGDYDYVVTAVVGSWTTTGTTASPIRVAADRTGPDIRLSGVDATLALLDRREGQDLLFFSAASREGGSLRIEAELTDPGVGPAGVRFPDVPTAGWTHAAEEVTTGTGSEPTVTYRSSPFVFERGAATPDPIDVTGLDDRGNESTVVVTVVDDSTSPSGGALTVNGREATAEGTTSIASRTFTIDVVVPFTEDATTRDAGLSSVTLTRESATLDSGRCGEFGGGVEVDRSAPVEQSGLSDGCYRYTLTGTDAVGNAASVHTTVQVDTTAPSGGAVRANGVDGTPEGSASYDRTGAWSLARTDYVDGGTGLASSTLVRSTSTLAGGTCTGTWSDTTLTGAPNETGVATGCVRYTLTGTDLAGLSSSTSTSVLVDREAPTSGSLVVNGTAASGAGTTSDRTSSSVTVQSVTNYSDAASGIQSSVLTRTFAPMSAGTCGTFDPATTETVPGAVTVVGLADGCHRFTLTGTDLAGNTSSISTTVRLDASVPSGGELTVHGVAGTPSGVLAYAPASPVAVAWTKFADPESGMTSALVRRTTAASLSNGVCGAFTGATSNLTTALTPLTGTANQALTTQCYRYVLTGTNSLGVVSSVQVTLVIDTSVPSRTGNLRINGSTTANLNSTTGSFAVTELRTYSDAQSGMASSILTRTWAPMTGGVCGTFDDTTTVAVMGAVPISQGPLDVGCYRYTQTGTNTVGGSSSVTTTVRVDSTAPVGGAFVANETGATTGTGSVSTSTTGAWTTVRTDFTDPEMTLTSTLTRAVASTLSNGTCGAFGTAATVTGEPTESGLTVGCVRYTLTGRNAFNLTAPVLTVTVRIDTSAPTGGALTVNGTPASAVGSTSTSATGTFTISTRTAFADAQIGMTSTTLTRTSGPTCAALDPGTATAISGSAPIAQSGLAVGCYRYVLTGVNVAGLTSTVSTSVTVGP